MNGMRQAFASAVLFYFLPRFLERKQFIKYLLLVLLVSTVHASALVFIPIYFIASKKAWSKYTAAIIYVCLFAYIFYNNGVGEFLANFLGDTAYGGGEYGEQLLNGNTSVNIIRVFIAAVPLILSLYTKRYREKGDRAYNIYFNMTLINSMLWLFASKVLYFYRLAMYFAPYSIVFLCNEIDYIAEKRDRRIIKTAAVICYLLYFIYGLYVTGNAFFVGYLKY
jgi:transmembrane protein EpsG